MYEKQKVDILLVIDNSASTTGERALLQQQGLLTPETDPGPYTISRARASRFGDIFNTTLKYADWQMGFTSFPFTNNPLYTLKESATQDITDSESNDPITILTSDLKDTYDLETIFKETVVSRQFGGSGTEITGLHEWINTDHPDKEKLVRKDNALFAVIFIADTDDHSQIDPDTIILDVEEHFGLDKKFLVYGITTKPNDETCSNLSSSLFAEKIEFLALITGGMTHSICDLNYESVMTKLGKHLINETLKDFHIELKHNNVIPGSIKLSANAPNFTYDATTNTLSFFQVPSGDLTITISYDYL